MAYGLKYQGEFSSTADDDYRLEILQKDYSGAFYTLPMAATPILHSWGSDEIKDVVKGSSLTINYLNTGSNPIENFYSNNDDEYKVIYYQGSQVLFVGFLVQDDFREPMIDYTHPVQLSANDNLGLLKDIALDKNPVTVGAYAATVTAQGDYIFASPIPNNWIYLRNCGTFIPVVGTAFSIIGHPSVLMNQTFTPIQVNILGSGNYDIRVGIFTGDTAAEPVTINGIPGQFNFYGRNTLLSVIAICLQNTGVPLETYIYENLYEQSHVTTKCSLDQTVIDFQTFLNGETFDSCFTVLEKICKRFHLTIFQALGRWNIIRWDELRLGTSINCFIYDEDFNLTGTDTLDSGMVFGFQEDTFPELGISKTGVRPYEFVKETFNYNQPKYLLKNYDLQTLGNLLRTYTWPGGFTVKEYVATGWENGRNTPLTERFIRVVTDSVGTETERYLVQRLANADLVHSVPGTSIEITKGDKIKFSFTTRSNWSVTSTQGILYVFDVELFDGVSTRHVDELPEGNGSWIAGTFNNYWSELVMGINADQWQTFTIESSQTPFTGLVTPWLSFTIGGSGSDINKEIHYKDIRFEVTQFINDSSKITGHIHKDKQPVVIKNNEATEISIDDSSRNSIAGTLFRTSFTGLVQDRTSVWHRDGISEAKKLGEITTKEQLQYRSNIRTRIDGDLYGIIQSGKYISPLTWFTYTQLPGLNFLFGQLQIDYRRNKINCSATEIFKDGEPDVDETYSFNYIYSAK